MTDQAFLAYIKLILEKAKTSTSYKFALLLVISKLCRDEADSDGFLSYEQLTDEIIAFYAPHNRPFIHDGKFFVVQQTNGRGGVVILDCLAQMQSGCFDYESNRKKIKNTLIKNPIAKLQVIDGKETTFLYDRQKDGIALHCANLFNVHYDTVSHLTKNAFLEYVLSLNANKRIADNPKAVWQFLFTHY